MKRRTVLFLTMLAVVATVVPFFALQVQGETDAGPDQTVYVDDAVSFNATTSEDINAVDTVTWDFGDGSQPVNGSDSSLFNSTHIYNATGEYNVTLSVGYNSQLNKTENGTLKVTVVENVAPVADAGPDQTVEQTSSAGAEVTLNGSASSDQYGDLLTYNWSWVGGSMSGVSPTVMLPQGTTEVTLTVNDGVFNATDAMNITVVDTTAPDVDAGDDVTVEATSYAGAEVTLVGTAIDIVDLDLGYVWKEGDVVLGTEANLTHIFSLGAHVLTLSATDDLGNTGTDTVTVEVVDTTAPELTVTVDPDLMWPPNHKYVDVETIVTVYDIADPNPTVTLVSVTSNEPENGKGDGNTTDDIQILSDTTFKLRAERSGPGEGRIYTITYTATDASGNSLQVSVTITVPHNK
jgi:hypothetical protein